MSAKAAVLAREAVMRERRRPAPTVHEMAAMTKAELVVIAKARGFSTSGTKADILERMT